MDYYRNVRLASDPTMNEKPAEEDEDTPLYLEAMAAINAKVAATASFREEEVEYEEETSESDEELDEESFVEEEE
jgi:hypothetical protein